MDEYKSPLKEWRTARNISKHKVATMTGVDPNTVDRFEKSGNISSYNLCRIADGTGLTTDWLLGRAKQ